MTFRYSFMAMHRPFLNQIGGFLALLLAMTPSIIAVAGNLVRWMGRTSEVLAAKYRAFLVFLAWSNCLFDGLESGFHSKRAQPKLQAYFQNKF